MKNVTICGGGALGHVIATWLSSRHDVKIQLLTGHPCEWNDTIRITEPGGMDLVGSLTCISDQPSEVIPQAEVILFCLPGFLIKRELELIKPFVGADAYVGSVFSSTGFFFEALQILPKTQPLWGFQRVPFISRVVKYGKEAVLLGYKDLLSVAVEHVGETERHVFRSLLEEWFEVPVKLLNNYYEASLTNSNPLLHTSRLYSMFGGSNEGRVYDRMILFYEEWTNDAAQLLIDMDREFFSLLSVLPVSEGFLPSILDYYESHDAASLAAKLSSIKGFKGITSPMILCEKGWLPDYSSRYFTEDFPFGLKYIWKLAHEKGVACPCIDKVYKWGMLHVSER